MLLVKTFEQSAWSTLVDAYPLGSNCKIPIDDKYGHMFVQECMCQDIERVPPVSFKNMYIYYWFYVYLKENIF